MCRRTILNRVLDWNIKHSDRVQIHVASYRGRRYAAFPCILFTITIADLHLNVIQDILLNPTASLITIAVALHPHPSSYARLYDFTNLCHLRSCQQSPLIGSPNRVFSPALRSVKTLWQNRQCPNGGERFREMSTWRWIRGSRRRGG